MNQKKIIATLLLSLSYLTSFSQELQSEQDKVYSAILSIGQIIVGSVVVYNLVKVAIKLTQMGSEERGGEEGSKLQKIVIGQVGALAIIGFAQPIIKFLFSLF